MLRLASIALYSVSFIVFVLGCATNDFPRRKVTIVDEAGNPVVGAGTYPQPFVPGPKRSADDGKIWVYGGAPGITFRINAVGFAEGEFNFDQESNICILKKS